MKYLISAKYRGPFLVFFATLALLMAFVDAAFARPEYAIRYGVNRCTACHESPAGGGARNVYGKLFGSFGYESSRWANQDYAGAELKMLYYRPANVQNVKDGLGTMNGMVWGNLPIHEMKDDQAELRLVAEQNLGGFAAGPRQWYARVAKFSDERTSWLPQYYLFGRIIPAFGIMTDEHRTYTRLQSGTSWNTGFDTGILMAANPVECLHYDLAVVNGQKNSGQGLQNNMADIWGGVGNLRWIAPSSPLGLGASTSWYGGTTTSSDAVAFSVYSLLSVHRLSRNHIPITISAEYVQARNWNDSFTAAFVSDSGYATTVKGSISRGWLGLLDWSLTQHLLFQYKFDYLALNQDYPADSYQRNGVGFTNQAVIIRT